MTPQPTQSSPDDEISLLDILVVLAENFWLLVLAPLVIGAIAFGIVSFLPKTYESTAVLEPVTTLDNSDTARSAGAATMVARLSSPEVRVPSSESQAWIRDRRLGSRELQSFLQDAVSVRSDRQSGLVTVTTYGPSAAEAQSFLQALLEVYASVASPQGPEREQILQRLKISRSALSIIDPAIAAFININKETGKVSSNLATLPAARPALADLVAQRAFHENTIQDLEKLLSTDAVNSILQSPTLEEKPVRPKRLQLTAIAVILSGLVLTVFVFIRAALRAAADNPEGVDKITRIRQGILRR
jgi:capsular polysaccharide biosynthesis protein